MYLVKITKSQYIDDLVNNGNLYLSLAESFTDTEKFGFLKVDTREGIISDAYRFGIIVNGKVNTLNDKYTVRVTGNECIFSFKWIDENDSRNYVFNESQQRFNLILGDYKFIDRLLGNEDVGEYSILVIKDSNGFLKRVKQEIERLGLNGVMGVISYDNHVYETQHEPFSDEYAEEAYFHKDDEYKVQQEYRILVHNIEHKHLILNIGKDFFTSENSQVHRFTKESISMLKKPEYYDRR